MFIGNAWYMAAWTDELSDKPMSRRICDQPIVLFRSVEGRAAALYDSCCHRGVPLSVGTVVDAGIQCGYHGLVFGCDGICVHIPGQDRIPARARVRSYPVRERDQMIWIWMGDPEQADTGLVIDYPFHNDRTRWPHRHGVYEVAASYLMLLDNLMDWHYLQELQGLLPLNLKLYSKN